MIVVVGHNKAAGLGEALDLTTAPRLFPLTLISEQVIYMRDLSKKTTTRHR